MPVGCQSKIIESPSQPAASTRVYTNPSSPRALGNLHDQVKPQKGRRIMSEARSNSAPPPLRSAILKSKLTVFTKNQTEMDYAIQLSMTFPPTSVSRKSRP